MININSPKTACPLGDETLFASIKAGYTVLTLGLMALYMKGFVPGASFSRKQLLACGLGPDLVKTMLKQCEGQQYDRRKSQKITSRIKNGTLTTTEEKELTESLMPNFSFLTKSDVKYHHSKIINLIKGTSSSSSDRKNPPEPLVVNELFSRLDQVDQSGSLDMAPNKAQPSRGRPARIFVIPTPDEYANLFGVTHLDKRQKHFQLLEYKNAMDLCDAIHRAWMEKELASESKMYALSELCNIQGDSVKTLREQNKRIGISTERNFFSYYVNQTVINFSLRKYRRECWLELEFPGSDILRHKTVSKKKKGTPWYPLTHDGLKKAQKKWDASGMPGNFYDHLRICGFDINSYFISDPTPFVDRAI